MSKITPQVKIKEGDFQENIFLLDEKSINGSEQSLGKIAVKVNNLVHSPVMPSPKAAGAQTQVKKANFSKKPEANDNYFEGRQPLRHHSFAGIDGVNLNPENRKQFTKQYRKVSEKLKYYDGNVLIILQF